MANSDTYLLTKSIENVFIGPHMTDSATNQSGASFAELNRLEEFWDVRCRVIS